MYVSVTGVVIYFLLYQVFRKSSGMSTDRQCRDSRQPVSRRGPARFAGIAPHAAGEPQISLRQRQADAKMAGVASGFFAVAQRRGLPDHLLRTVLQRRSQNQIDAVHVIGLGCGGGQKDTRLLKLLKARGKEVFYTPCDVSTAMVLVARQTALTVVPEKNCFPFVCDLATADDLPALFAVTPIASTPSRTRHFLRHDSEF